MNLLVYYTKKNSNGDVAVAGSQVLTDDDITYIDTNKIGEMYGEIQYFLCKKIGESPFRNKNIQVLSIEFVEE